MTLQQAIETLKAHQRYRKGHTDAQPHPAILAAAIDEAIAALEEKRKHEDDGK